MEGRQQLARVSKLLTSLLQNTNSLPQMKMRLKTLLIMALLQPGKKFDC